MKKLSLKALCASISTLMAMMAITTPIAQATDTEIYQVATKGKTTLMLTIDISGSMGDDAFLTDYALQYSQAINPCYYGGGYPSRRKIKTENVVDASGNKLYSRSFCDIPKNQVNNANYYARSRYYYPQAPGAWVTDPKGCNLMGTGGGQFYRCYDRMSRLKEALYDTLAGNPVKGIERLSDDKIIGIATLGVVARQNGQPWTPTGDPLNSPDKPYYRDAGAVRVPARPLDEVVNGKTQRQHLLDLLKDEQIFRAYSSTPTARSYAEVVSYMMGTTTLENDVTMRQLYMQDTRSFAQRWCTTWQPNGICSRWVFNASEAPRGAISGDTSFVYPTTIPQNLLSSYFRAAQQPNARMLWGYYSPTYGYSGSGFPFSSFDAKKADRKTYQAPESLTQPERERVCNGQGVYMLSDGAPSILPGEERMMRLALGSQGSSFSCGDDDWTCIHKFSETLLDGTKNPHGIKFKTAAVGFGRPYIFAPAYDSNKKKTENLKAIDDYARTLPSEATLLAFDGGRRSYVDVIHSPLNFARWGIKGEGGWYSGNRSEDVVNSINAFISQITTDIPEVVTGQPFIPVNPLNPLRYMDDAYYGTFTPKVGSSYRFWAGDMNKYLVKNQKILGKDGNPLFDDTGFINSGATGYWDAGVASKLPLRQNQRQVFTNTDRSVNTPLTKVTVNNLYGGNAVLSNLVYRNAWLNALGYRVDVNGTPVEQSALPTIPELRQVGAVLHSTPIILTQTGKVVRDSGGLNTSDGREDYLLYGSTQGMIHVVNTQTGMEKVAFVPQEMITGSTTRPDNRQNFQDAETALGAMNYGMDGQWTAYTQYKALDSGGFTVNDPNNTAATSTNLGGFGLQWVYGGMRMGGRSYYALDLSNVDAPKLKFHIAPESAALNTPLYYMGQSWSKPVLGFVRWQGQRRLVMFVGGGYDAGYENRLYDQATANTTGQASGAGVYMFDAHTGELLWWSSKYAPNTTASGNAHSINNPALQYSVVSNISTFDRDNDGLVDNLIFGDLGGQVFRVDLDNGYDHTDNSKSLATRVVRVYNGHQPGGLSPRFYDTPSLSVHSQEGVTGQFGVISIASGNRSSPLAVNTESARDGLFVIFDRDVLKRGMAKSSFTPSVTDAGVDKLTEVTRATNTEVKATDGVQGWKFYFTAANGRLKGYSSPRVVDNFLFVSTYTPEGGTVEQSSCSAGIIGESFQEVFCMPGGVCNKETTKRLGESVVGNTNPEDGSKFRFKLGVGIVQAGTGNAKDSSNANTYGTVSPTVDCTKSAYKNSPACLQEISSISNKPVRWYEDTPRTKAN